MAVTTLILPESPSMADFFRDPVLGVPNPPAPILDHDEDRLPSAQHVLRYLLWFGCENEAGIVLESDPGRRTAVRAMVDQIHRRWNFVRAYRAQLGPPLYAQQDILLPAVQLEPDHTWQAAQLVEHGSQASSSLGPWTNPPLCTDFELRTGRRWSDLMQLCDSDEILLVPDNDHMYSSASAASETGGLDLTIIERGTDDEFRLLKQQLLASGTELVGICSKLQGLAEVIDHTARTSSGAATLELSWTTHIKAILRVDTETEEDNASENSGG